MIKEFVVLLHGLGRSEKSMLLISHQLKKANYEVININYPSMDHSISELAEIAVGDGLAQCHARGATIIHFVTHSLGGILVRQYFKHHHEPLLGRVVMLGPPNNGSEVIDKYRHLKIFQQLTGPAGLTLGTNGNNDVPHQLGAVNFELGIIAGSKSINPFLSLILPGPDDGKVTIESAKVAGMSDFIILPTTHPTMLMSSNVIKHLLNFLRDGRFKAE
ncbi:MAG: alpha/beta fold hydrolase [Gammaproteobacteria bacterium]|nr:alpha/beta fold hydrolase [Gammaproteobacteria bacterium]